MTTTHADLDQARRPLVAEPGVRFGLANLALVLALFAGAVCQLSPNAMAVVAVLAAAGSSVGLALWPRIALGVIAWAFVTGFVENQFGQLTLAPADLLRLAGFATVVPVIAAAFSLPGDRR